MGIEDEAVYHWGRQPDQNYITSAFPELSFDPSSRMLRFGVRVIDSDNLHICDVHANEMVIRQTMGDRQQIKALFYEDDRSIRTLILQRFTAKTNKPHINSFSFSGDEIQKILWLLETVSKGQLDHSGKSRFSDNYIEEMLGDDTDLLRFVQRHRERLGQLDSVGEFALYLEFCERKRQVEVFERLLRDPDYFAQMQQEWDCHGHEPVWQKFFERNPWIFGLSLSPLFMTTLDGEKLEQVVRGHSVTGEGKRVDGLMRTNGILSSLCFVEIKTHATPLLHTKAYRSGAWSISSYVAGAIAQCHTTVQAAMKEFQTRLTLNDDDGNPTGDEFFLYQPRCYLVVGCLDEFMTEHGPNESKFRSFELYRRSMRSPEVVTFDELLERARATIECSPSMIR